MWDLNRAERRALAASLLLVGLAGASRAAWMPERGTSSWRGVGASDASPRAEVSAALRLEARAQTPLEPDERIDVGSAPAEELRRLPGVGPSLAEAIIRERSARPFRTLSDLERVPGIGPATAERLAPRVSLDPLASPAGGIPLPRPGVGPASRGGACPDGRVDVNSASASRLEELPGVGPALAGRILEHRELHGGFASPAALEDVSGIGPRSSARLAPLICAG